MPRLTLLSLIACGIALLAACGEPSAPGAAVTEPVAGQAARVADPPAEEPAPQDSEPFEPPQDWCGTGRLGRGIRLRPPKDAPIEPPPPSLPFRPSGASDDESSPPQNWCGTGRVGGVHPPDLWGPPDVDGRSRKRVRVLVDGKWKTVYEVGEVRSGKFRTWYEDDAGRKIRGRIEKPSDWAARLVREHERAARGER